MISSRSSPPFPIILHGAPEDVAEEDYSWCNHDRKPPGTLVLQRTLLGEGLLEDADGVHPVRENQAMLFAYGEPTRYRIGPPETRPYHLSYVVIEPSGDIAALARSIRQDFGSILQMDAAGEAAALVATIAAEFVPGAAVDSLRLSELAYRLFVAIYREQISGTAGSDPTAYLHHLLQSRFREPRNISEWTDSLALSREHLSRLFHRRYGESPAAFLRRLRLRHADLLRHSRHLTADDIARACGFASPETLRRAYRRAYGHSLRGEG